MLMRGAYLLGYRRILDQEVDEVEDAGLDDLWVVARNANDSLACIHLQIGILTVDMLLLPLRTLVQAQRRVIVRQTQGAPQMFVAGTRVTGEN